jgi:hypothetical protein
MEERSGRRKSDLILGSAQALQYAEPITGHLSISRSSQCDLTAVKRVACCPKPIVDQKGWVGVEAGNQQLRGRSLAAEQTENGARDIAQKCANSSLEGNDIPKLALIVRKGAPLLNEMEPAKPIIPSKADLVSNKGDGSVPVKFPVLPVYVVRRIEENLIDPRRVQVARVSDFCHGFSRFKGDISAYQHDSPLEANSIDNEAPDRGFELVPVTVDQAVMLARFGCACVARRVVNG